VTTFSARSSGGEHAGRAGQTEETNQQGAKFHGKFWINAQEVGAAGNIDLVAPVTGLLYHTDVTPDWKNLTCTFS
jgi:hypothetical protein